MDEPTDTRDRVMIAAIIGTLNSIFPLSLFFSITESMGLLNSIDTGCSSSSPPAESQDGQWSEAYIYIYILGVKLIKIHAYVYMSHRLNECRVAKR